MFISDRSGGFGGFGGDGGNGGGIYVNSGTAKVLDSQINSNITGDGHNGGALRYYMANGGWGGAGGGIYNHLGVTTLDQVVILGNIIGKGGNAGEGGSGGGVYNASSKLTINSSLIQTNQTGKGGDVHDYGYPDQNDGKPGGRGGGIYNQGDLLIFNSQIESNRTGDGGDSDESDFEDNRCGPGGHGGGIFNQGAAQVTYSQLVNNITGNSGELNGSPGYANEGGSGGGVFNTGELSLEYTDILSNTTGDGGPDMHSGSGGGLCSSGNLYINGAALQNNQVGQIGAGGFGAGAYITDDSTVVMHNTLIADNHIVSKGRGSGILADTVTLDLSHTTLARNTGGDGSGLHAIDATVGLTNTILVSHTVGITATESSAVSLDYTLWGSASWANVLDFGGSGNITHIHDLIGPPDFLAPDAGDYHIQSGSYALDQGISSFVTTDIDNQLRPNPDTHLPDLGADEYWNPISISEVAVTGPISGTTFTTQHFTATVTPTSATPNIFYVWVPHPNSGQGTSVVTYTWAEAGQKTFRVTALNVNSSAHVSYEISIFASKFKIFMPYISHIR